MGFWKKVPFFTIPLEGFALAGHVAEKRSKNKNTSL